MNGLLKYCIFVILLVLFSAFLPFPICTLFWIITYILIFSGIITSFVCVINSLFQKKERKNNIIIFIIFIISFFIYNNLYNFERGFYTVYLNMKNTYKNFKIVGIDKMNLDEGQMSGYNYIKCKYMFNVKLKDESNITFQSGYCNMSGFIPTTGVIDNYDYYYIPYYYEQYKKSNNISFKLEKGNNKYDYENFKFIYNNDNSNELYNFIKYLKNKINDKNYYFKIYNESTKVFNHVSLDNDNYEMYLRER